MKSTYKTLFFLIPATILIIVSNTCKHEPQELSWPAITGETKPWARWWWMGSAVNKADLTVAMEEYSKAGIGGLEITPIYGVKGYEDQFIQYLSPEWVEILLHTLNEANRLGMGVDMATGTGWPFGGPWVSSEYACKNINVKTFTLNGGEMLEEQISLIQEPLVRTIGRRVDISELAEPVAATKDIQSIAPDQIRFRKTLQLLVLIAYSDAGDILDLTDRVGEDGKLDWTAPAGKWTLYALFPGWHGKMVERAAPGGEGDVIDHFSKKALSHYLEKFDQAFKGKDIHSIRAFFNDSYEVDDARGQADWTPDLSIEFQKRRGYNLYDHLPGLFGKASDEENIRVLCDFRTTISELLLEHFTTPWKEWAVGKDAIIRYQAHGSPANILDLYAAADIPETEGTDIPGIKLASSAAHVTGKILTSSESATWLNEHFLSALSDVKANLDNFYLGGVNHVFYHGTTFSPQAETWPGWMFYASVHVGPTNTFWIDFPALNTYVARCQSFLQTGIPDNDILIYYPFYDLISVPGRGLLEHFSSDIARYSEPPFYPDARLLFDRGYSFDYISDRQVEHLVYNRKTLKAASSSFRAIILPQCKFIPVETFERLVHLAAEGAIIIAQQTLPGDVPGMAHLEIRRDALKRLTGQLVFKPVNESSVLKAELGKGAFLLGSDMDELLSLAGVERETMVDYGLQFIRRKDDQGSFYFIVNRGKDTIDTWIPIRQELQYTGLFNPVNGKCGLTTAKENEEGIEIYLQLMPGESCIVKFFKDQVKGPLYEYFRIAGEPGKIEGPWKVTFMSGGPVLPGELFLMEATPWTDLNIESLNKFSGTAKYSVSFKRPQEQADGWILDLGRVSESAKVRLNGKEIGTLIGPSFRLQIPNSQFKEDNLLEIDVSNLMANRIADLDRQSVEWKKFYNVNFPAKFRENRGPDGLFNASHWEPLESGLKGPVKLTPIKFVKL